MGIITLGELHDIMSEYAPITGLSVRRDLLDTDLTLDDFRVQFAPEATIQQKQALQQAAQNFIGQTPAQRRATLEARRPQSARERITELEAQVADLLARVAALESA